MSLSKNWEGKLLDASGPTALVRLTLSSRGEDVRGDFRVYLDPPDDECADPTNRLSQVGSVVGSFNKKEGAIELRSDMEIQQQSVSVALTGSVVDADPHAVQAIYGRYDVLSGDELLTLEGGVCVLWHYAGSDREG